MFRVRHTLAAALAAFALAAPALAAPTLKLSWDHCSADGRVANKAFACDTNSGSELLVLSFDPPQAMSDVYGFEITAHIKSSSGTMPAWWQFESGGCRASQLVSEISAASAGNCVFPYTPSVAGGIAGLAPNLTDPGLWRLRAATAVPSDQPLTLTPGQDHYLMAIAIRHAKTVGSGACEGCTTPMCLGFGSLKIVTVNGLNDLYMVAGGPNTGGSDETVTWQGAYVRDYTSVRDRFTDYTTMTCDPDNSVPARRSAWGAVKSLYR